MKIILILLSAYIFSSAHAELEVHEWGTFTSVVGSDGSQMEGLQHTEEALPPFVYGRSADALAVCCKRFEVKPKSGTALAVNQKLETPVLYFYSDHTQNVTVGVSFPGGVLSEWYPNASYFSPELGNIHEMKNGKMSWAIEVSKKSLPLPAVSPDDIWFPSRQVNSDTVKVGNEAEKFIFYRGLGNFSVPLTVKNAKQVIVIENKSSDTIQNAFLLRVEHGQGLVQKLGSIAANASLSVTPQKTSGQEMTTYLVQVKQELKTELIASGLYADEATAMVNTWSKSYFKTPGLRVLYIVPRAWTDRLLPIQISPTPNHLIRTLVGRVEVMTVAEETQLQKDVHDVQSTGSTQVMLDHLGRFAEPKLLRIKALSHESSVQGKIDHALSLIE